MRDFVSKKISAQILQPPKVKKLFKFLYIYISSYFFHIHFLAAFRTKNVIAPTDKVRVHTTNFTIGLPSLVPCPSSDLFFETLYPLSKNWPCRVRLRKIVSGFCPFEISTSFLWLAKDELKQKHHKHKKTMHLINI